MDPIHAHNDDKPIGRLLSRREVLRLLGGSGAALLIGGMARLNWGQGGTPTPTPTLPPTATGTPLPSCIVRPELTEGPYFVDEMLNRSDIRLDPADNSVKEGVLLHLIFNVSDISANACTPLQGAQVDVWHCDALGLYSDVQDRYGDTVGQKWLRGYQLTDQYGIAGFTTIYPGWYSGRTVHIHFKIRPDPDSELGHEYTSQLFFDEGVTDQVHALEPYASKGMRDTLNEEDGIFQASEGLLTLNTQQEDDDSYTAIFGIGLDLSQPTQSDLPGDPGGPGGAPRGTPPPRGS